MLGNNRDETNRLGTLVSGFWTVVRPTVNFFVWRILGTAKTKLGRQSLFRFTRRAGYCISGIVMQGKHRRPGSQLCPNLYARIQATPKNGASYIASFARTKLVNSGRIQRSRYGRYGHSCHGRTVDKPLNECIWIMQSIFSRKFTATTNSSYRSAAC